ncbi:unnamed protein product [Amoebophrya sp. A25]|nr:unnamed protein product [Amoebophrya sp. A25]|eukprot:GSA25T00012026001.1
MGVPRVVDFSAKLTLNKRRQQAGAALQDVKGGNNVVDQIVLIDRKTDITSLFCSQFTYESLLDQEFGIAGTKAALPATVVGSEVGQPAAGASSFGGNKTEGKQLLRLGNDDALFRDVRHSHVSQLGPLLRRKTLEMQQVEAEKDTIQTVQEMQHFMAKLKTLTTEKPLLSAHVNLAAYLNEKKGGDDFHREWRWEDAITSCTDTAGKSLAAVEEGMDNGWPLKTVLRLLCLYSEVYQGLPSQGQYEQLKRGILQVYGYEVLPLLQTLEQTQLLTGPRKGTDKNHNWAQVKKDFALVVEKQDAPEDAFSYAYSGYAPLSVRLVQKLASPHGWRGSVSDSMALLAGPVLEADREPRRGKTARGSTAVETLPGVRSLADHVADVAGAGVGAIMGAGAGNASCNFKNGSTVSANPASATSSDVEGGSQRSKIVFVFFIGGATYGEIAALRRLSEMEGGERKFLIGATNFTSPEKMFRSLEASASLLRAGPPLLPQDRRRSSTAAGSQSPEKPTASQTVLDALPGRSWFRLG